jgi:hypothetical protein
MAMFTFTCTNAKSSKFYKTVIASASVRSWTASIWAAFWTDRCAMVSPILHISTLARADIRSWTLLIWWTACKAYRHTFICRVLSVSCTALFSFPLQSEIKMKKCNFRISSDLIFLFNLIILLGSSNTSSILQKVYN